MVTGAKMCRFAGYCTGPRPRDGALLFSAEPTIATERHCCRPELAPARSVRPIVAQMREAELKLVQLCLVGVMLLGGAGCVWGHGPDRGGGNRGAAGYSDQRGGNRGDMRNQGGGQDRRDDRRPQEHRQDDNR